jgi:tetratricopeptide (TPR) repeat protein
MYQDIDKAQSRRRQTDEAISLARASRWEEAVAANRAILKTFPNDVDACNRLGKALMELNRYPDAKKAYRRALELDSTNQIAKKNLERLVTLAKGRIPQAETTQVDPNLFIEEMGKTAVTLLQQPALDILAKLNAGDRVDLRPRNKTVVVETPKGELIGVLEPKLRARMLRLLEGGNQYAAAVTSLTEDQCRIIIKETYKDPSLAGRPSFPTAVATESLRPYTKERLVKYSGSVATADRDSGDDDDALEEGGDAWDSDQVAQEGDVRLNDAAAAEDMDDDELEE